MESIIEFFATGFGRLVLWFEEHDNFRAFFIGCLFSIVFTQSLKIFYPVKWDLTTVKRVSQMSAILSGAIATFILYPVESPNGILFAVMSGMSSPVVYTGIKYALPNITRKWGWTAIQKNKVNRVIEKAIQKTDNEEKAGTDGSE